VPALTREDDVVVLDLGDGEHRFTLDWLSEVQAASTRSPRPRDPGR
jgi:hypothetical protein